MKSDILFIKIYNPENIFKKLIILIYSAILIEAISTLLLWDPPPKNDENIIYSVFNGADYVFDIYFPV